MLNVIYYPVSAILWFWHKAFAFVLPQGFAWTLAVVFLVFTLRALLYKPFVHQVRSMRKMQEFAPEIQKLKKKYGNDKQKMATEMQKLQGEHGVNPLGGCLPVFVQLPVFIGLFHVLKGFNPTYSYNYVFSRADIESFNAASVFGSKLGAALKPYAGGAPLEAYDTTVAQQLVVMIPLAIAAAVFTHITARHSIARQTEAQAANPQAAMMNKLMLWLFPVGAIAGSPFLPLAILVYWVANNLWTLGQQRLVYNKIDSEEAEQKTHKTEVARNLAPKVGQKPVQDVKQKKPGAKPIAPRGRQNGKPASKPDPTTNGVNGSQPHANGSSPDAAPGRSPTAKRGRKR
ncbi:MAG: membrane protein insertase YidC [Actinomycetota bacterium]|nr:membrane protein insertase YidC [Actinomycetota bacterium]